uniref:Putative tropomyosin n=1 Tax=Rhipicephalus pulchellus TaxID=72859 RepID=L7LVU6_RHIPC
MSAVQQGTLLEVLKKKMRAMKDELETAKEQAEDAQSRVMEEIRRREEAEAEVAAHNRRIQLLEEDLERSEERLKIATQKLEEASQAADESERYSCPQISAITLLTFEHVKRTRQSKFNVIAEQLGKWRVERENCFAVCHLAWC